jgi:hypothetical protein
LEGTPISDPANSRRCDEGTVLFQCIACCRRAPFVPLQNPEEESWSQLSTLPDARLPSRSDHDHAVTKSSTSRSRQSLHPTSPLEEGDAAPVARSKSAPDRAYTANRLMKYIYLASVGGCLIILLWQSFFRRCPCCGARGGQTLQKTFLSPLIRWRCTHCRQTYR